MEVGLLRDCQSSVQNKSINDSFELTFVEEKWNTQSKFVCPTGGGAGRKRKRSVLNVVGFDSGCLTAQG